MQLDELGQRPQGVARVALDLGRAGEVAEHERVRRRAVDQAERDARVRRVQERALALDPEHVSPRARAPSTTSCSAAPAMKSETTASTEIPQPAIAIPVCPVGTNTERSPRRFASRSSSSETVIFPIAQSEPTVRTIRAGSSRFAPVGTLRPSGGLRRSRSSTPCRAASSDQLGVVHEVLVQAVLDVEPGRDRALQELAPRRREPPALRGDADERRRRLEARAPPRPCRRPGSPSWLSPARSESRIATVGSAP